MEGLKMGKPVIHGLPERDNGETGWFNNQNQFEQQEILRQVDFKDRTWPGTPPGPFSKRPNYFYPHILPTDLGVFYSEYATEIKDYFKNEDIEIHSEVLNLKSSQVACVNFLWPLKRDPKLAVDVLGTLLPDVKSVDRIEFEDTGELPDKPGEITRWLGEPPGGKRGQNRTSIDCSVYWRDSQQNSNITLIEWKYTERAFGNCSAYQSGSREEKSRCNTVLEAVPDGICLLVGNGPRRNRKYWSLLEQAGIKLENLKGLGICPFSGPLYQLMRQFLIAAYLRMNDYDNVNVVDIAFAGNTSLRSIPRELKPLVTSKEDTVIDIWNRFLEGVPALSHINVEDLMAQYDQSNKTDLKWRDYIKDRYGV
jgi:hypothetical protein